MNKLAVIVIFFAIILSIYLYLFILEAPVGDNPNAAQAPQVERQEDGQESKPTIIITPDKITQGDPALISIDGVDSLAEIKSLTLNGKKLNTFVLEGRPSALIGIDLRGKTGAFPIVLNLKSGEEVRGNLIVGERAIAKAPLGIPDKLGGDTPQAEKELISTLVEEGRLINSIPSSSEQLWSGNFRYPVPDPVVVTDTYGYSRLTGASTISHKGTDFRAPVGTAIYAMNSGLVRYTDLLRNYGNTIVLDHGLGLQSIYMHLSEILVKEGEQVQKGQLIAKSGQTGYTFGPHLHLTIKIGGISIDPEKFLTLFVQ